MHSDWQGEVGVLPISGREGRRGYWPAPVLSDNFCFLDPGEAGILAYTEGTIKPPRKLLFPKTAVWDTLVEGLKGFKLLSPTSGQPLRRWAWGLGKPSALREQSEAPFLSANGLL